MMNAIGFPQRGLAAAGLVLLLGLPSLAAAQAGGIGGTLVDDEGSPVEGVEITLTASGLSAKPRVLRTNKDGKFLVSGLTPGRYQLSYDKQGYESASQEVQVRIGERNRLGDVRLPRLPDDWIDPGAQEYFDAGVAATQAEDYDAAVASFLKVLDMAPDVPEVHFDLGFAYEKLENMDDAIEHYERALELRPDYYEPLIPLSDYYTRNRDWSRAAEYLKRAIELRPDEVTSQYNYGAVSMNAGAMDVAEAAFTRVLELEPTRSGAHYQLGMICVSETRNDEAIEHFEAYVELDPDGAQAAAAKGIIETLKGQP